MKWTRTLWGVLFSAVLIAAAGCSLVRVDLGPSMQPFQERTLAGSGSDKVLMVDLSGVMYLGAPARSRSPWSRGEDMISRLAEELQTAREDPSVKALLVRIDSPGGTVAAADVIYHEIESYKQDTGVKVVAGLMGVAASGGYYAALAADRIVALPTTVTGSIGVITMKLDLEKVMGRIGVKTETVKSGLYKDLWTPFRPSSDEERRIMQELIDDMFARFLEKLRTGRPGMTPAQVEKAATGRVFSARQAMELGLVDEMAYPKEAFETAKKMAGLEEARLVVYHRPGAWRGSIYAQAPATSDSGFGGLDMLTSPQLMYLWLPGLGAGESVLGSPTF
jgi:protease-4